MKYLTPIFLASVLALQLGSCINMDNDDLKSYTWRYTDGYRMGDVLEFDDTNLKGDTIYSENKSVAIIITRSREIPFRTSFIDIKDIQTDEVGTYHEIRSLR